MAGRLLHQPAGRARRLGRRSEGPADRATGAHPLIPGLPGAALLAGSLGALVLAISEGPTWGWTSRGILSSFAGALVLGAGFLARSARHRSRCST